jgi:hypothetical protein
MFDDRKARCRVCNQRYVEDLTSIDTLVPEKREELDAIFFKFNLDGEAFDPLTRALNRENGL